MVDLSLGSGTTHYTNQYAPELLYPIERGLQRQKIGISTSALPFSGQDIWNGYEFSWLTRSGKPAIGIIRLEVPASSPLLIESKSMKLYLGSFSGSRFDSASEVLAMVQADVSAATQASVTATLVPVADSLIQDLEPGVQSLDHLDVEMAEFIYRPERLTRLSSDAVEETLYTDLFRSLCPITGQPDYARILIAYAGPEWDKKSLLQYLMSFREHAEFAEQVSERIFLDIMIHCTPEKLVVGAEFTRRGGLDINSYRSKGFEDWRYHRNYRQ
ncbi:MAG: NADPH-dependent 7-cyano-7-deazaguanine reductase QueF [Gammaproteobacteria bacterium]|nr:NADPH-dependent 7-cyano-7-deazaguanine reductase QueF [Gammaproteobacteria bacterium]